MQATRPLNEIIAAWLDLTKDQPPPPCLPFEKTLRRAEDLRQRLRQGDPPALVDLDEDSKDVLFVLVGLVCDECAEGHESSDSRAAEAARLYHFIEQTRWEQDEFGQKNELLTACKEIAGNAFAREAKQATVQKQPEPASAEQQAGRIFEDSRATIRLILRSAYRMTETQADEAERALLAWLERFCRRPTTPQNFRRALLAACSQLAPKLAPARPRERATNLLDYRSTGVFGTVEGDQDSGK
jgi:hypothetical protein